MLFRSVRNSNSDEVFTLNSARRQQSLKLVAANSGILGQRMAFGEHKIRYFLIGLGIAGVAVAGLVKGWLGKWGMLVFGGLLLFGLACAFFLGHAPQIALMLWNAIGRRRD